MNRTDTRKQVTPGFAGMRKDDDGDYDETDSGGFGKVDMPQQARSDMGIKGDDEDEAEDEGMVAQTNAPQGPRAGSGYRGEDAEEASEMRQKAGNMGGKGMKASAPKIKGQDVSDAEEMENPARKVVKGREEPSGHEPDIEGAHQGSGHGGEPRHFSNLGHGEREAKISGAHQGQHGGASMAGEGFEAGGSVSKERARGPTGTKR
jgi:hypothetical protein